jgi:hypothetical protein
MACIYEDYNGYCTYDANIELPPTMKGKEGECAAVGKDYDNCDCYESMQYCDDCGADLELEQCTCEEDYCPHCMEHYSNCDC